MNKMNNIMKKIIAFAGACTMVISSAANVMAADFVDMPDNWTTEALENAVKNGLLYGSEAADGSGMMVNPDKNITRAQMAAIIVRAFGASETTDISSYVDVDSDAWYYEELSKAVAMNAFRGDGDKMNPDKNITFQECYTVISQVLQLHVYNDENSTILDKYSDSDSVAEWALPYATAIAECGYWTGIDGDYTLTPTEYITRSQFAVLMNNVVETYIDEPGEYTYDETMGNVMIRSTGVVLNGVNIDGDLIIGDGVEGETLANESTVTHFAIVRGGEGFTIKGSNIDTIIMARQNLVVTDGGSCKVRRVYGDKTTKYVMGVVEFETKEVTEEETEKTVEVTDEKETEQTEADSETTETEETTEE